MTPSDFPQANQVYFRPRDMTDEECAPLHVCAPASHDALISRWVPSWRERLAILFGQPVWLWVIHTGTRHPPVSIEVQDPFRRTK